MLSSYDRYITRTPRDGYNPTLGYHGEPPDDGDQAYDRDKDDRLTESSQGDE